MSQYEPYEAPVSFPWASTAMGPGSGTTDRGHEPSAALAVLARVPNLEPAAAPALRVARPESSEPAWSRWFEGLSPRFLGMIGATILLVGVAGFMLGRASRSETVAQPNAWCPPPPAPSASEAPAWNGGALVGGEPSQAAPQRSMPELGNPLPPTAPEVSSSPWNAPAAPINEPSAGQDRFSNEHARAVAAGREGTLASPDYSGVSTAAQPQTGANRQMRLESPPAPSNDNRGADNRYQTPYTPLSTPWPAGAPSMTR